MTESFFQAEANMCNILVIWERQRFQRWSRVASYGHFRTNAWGCRLHGGDEALGTTVPQQGWFLETPL